MRRIEPAQCLARVFPGGSDKRQYDGGIGDFRFDPDQARNHPRIDPAAARLAGVGHDRIAKSKIGARDFRVGFGRNGLRKPFDVEPIVGGAFQPQGHRGNLGVGAGPAKPERREIAQGVKGGDRLALPGPREGGRLWRTGTRFQRGFERGVDRRQRTRGVHIGI